MAKSTASGTVQAILFDMDGVLIDARDWHYEALNRALGLFGMEIGPDEHRAVYDGLPTRRKLEMLSGARGLPVKLHEFLNRLKQSYTTEMIYARCRPVFQHQYALSRLRQEGYHLAVCSNSIRETVRLMMERAALAPHLDFFLSNEDVTKAKPDPEIYTKAIEKLGLPPSACLIVEDNDHGIRAARASGAHVMVVGSPTDVTLPRIKAAIAEAEAAK
jgi:HAD superfamily hydrolase (TIGR01509 family)